MDLSALVMRLTLDSGDYEAGLEGARASLFQFGEDALARLAQVDAALGASLDAACASIDGGVARASSSVSALSGQIGPILGALSSAAEVWGEDMVQGFIDGITARWGALRARVASVAQSVKNYLGFSEPKEGPLSDFHTYAPDMMALFARGIRENEGLVTGQIDESFAVAPRIARAMETPGPLAAPAESSRPISVIFELNGAQQWIYKLNKAEEQRVGLRLAK